MIHNPSTNINEVSSTVVDESNEPSFSDLLYDLIYTKNTDITGLKTVFASAIKDFAEKTESTDNSVKSTVPGSPIIEFVATEQGKKWNQLSSALEKDGLSKYFSGILINGRVSRRHCNRHRKNF